MVRYCRLVNLSETEPEMVKSWPEMENPGVIAQANLEALVIKRLSWPQPDQPLGLGIQVPPRHGHLKLMIDAIGHLTASYFENGPMPTPRKHNNFGLQWGVAIVGKGRVPLAETAKVRPLDAYRIPQKPIVFCDLIGVGNDPL